jgi:hypothetical protein
MGRHRRNHKHKNKNQRQQACGHANCDDQCKTKEPEAEIVQIETQQELQELLDLIMNHGADRAARWQRSQTELNNALLADVGIPIPAEKPEQSVVIETPTDEETAI